MKRVVDRIQGVVDPAIAIAPTPGPGAAIAKIAVAVTVLATVALSLLTLSSLVDWAAPGDLVWPVGPDVWTGIVFLSVFLLILAGVRIVAQAGGPSACGRDARGWVGRADALIGGPILLVVLVSGSARVAVQVAGFAGLHPVQVPVAFTVVATRRERGRHEAHDHYLLRLRFAEHGRVFSREVAEPVYDAAREGDAVVLPVETGRFALQRAMPTAPLTIDDLRHAQPAG